MKFTEKIKGTWEKIKEKLFKRKSDDTQVKIIEEPADSRAFILDAEEPVIPADASRTTEEYIEWQKEQIGEENEK